MCTVPLLCVNVPSSKIANPPDKPNIVVVVHHPSVAYEDDWKMNNQPAQIARINHFLKPLGYNVKFIEMETTMPNGVI